MDHLTILYRGPLASCDYACPYCPFAKRRDTPEQLRADRAALERFTRWVSGRDHRVSVLFTPWGEGLVRSWYRRALVELSHLPHVERAVELPHQSDQERSLLLRGQKVRSPSLRSLHEERERRHLQQLVEGKDSIHIG